MSRAITLLSLSRSRLIAFECFAAASKSMFTMGSDRVDARLGNGLARAALHELFATNVEDVTATAGFALLLALRAQAGKSVIWVRADRGGRNIGRFYAPGLIELGADPSKLLLVTAPNTLAALRAGVDIIGCGAVGTVVFELWGKAAALDFTTSRRLALAAAKSGVLALVLRLDATPVPSAATTRWAVKAAPSVMLAAGAPGRPAFDISLLRHRGGLAGFDVRVEWDRDRQSFCDPPVSGGVPAAAPGRTRVDVRLRAA